MSKKKFFTFGSYRRRRSGAGRRILLCLAAAFLLVAIGVRHYRQPGQPAFAFAETQNQVLLIPGRVALLRQLLAQVIPGLEQPTAQGKNNLHTEDILAGAVSRLDPRDPRKLFSTQIPYLGEVVPQPETLLYRTPEPREHVTPRIIVPAQGEPTTGGSRVIIYHTHTTESFVPTSGQKFSEDLDATVARLGAELSSVLQKEYGIPVVHNRQIHDIPRSTSYEIALNTLKALLDTYPDSRLVIDLHRDGVDRSITTAQINGQALGRILFVVGTRHQNWQENLSKAAFLHEALEELAPGLSRGVRERPLVYNQHLHAGSLLIEVGGHENSLDEALLSVPYLAKALARNYYGR